MKVCTGVFYYYYYYYYYVLVIVCVFVLFGFNVVFVFVVFCYNKGRGMCNPVCGVVHIKHPLLLIEKGSPCSGGNGFPFII